MADHMPVLRNTSRVVVAVLVVSAAWVSGLLTCRARIDSCTWMQRNGWLLFLALGSVTIFGFHCLHRLPQFKAKKALWKTQTLAGFLLLPWFIGAFACGPEMFGAVERSRQKKTLADMRSIAAALDEYDSRQGNYPEADSLEKLTSICGHRIPLPERDGWGRPYIFASNTTGYTLISRGRCGSSGPADKRPGKRTGSDANIVMVDGHFIRCPAGFSLSPD